MRRVCNKCRFFGINRLPFQIIIEKPAVTVSVLLIGIICHKTAVFTDCFHNIPDITKMFASGFVSERCLGIGRVKKNF